jgi:hypothetical protein
MSLGTGDDAAFVGWNIICGFLCAISLINSFQANGSILSHDFGVFFFKGCISLKKRT